MTTNHASKPGVRYRYYNTRTDVLNGAPAWRVSAHDLELLVCNRIAELLRDQQSLCALLRDAAEDARLVRAAIATGDVVAAQLRSNSYTTQAQLIERILGEVILRADRVEILLCPSSLLSALGVQQDQIGSSEAIVLSCPVLMVRRGHQVRLVIPSPETAPRVNRDEKLVALVADAHGAAKLLWSNPGQSIAEIAKGAARCRSRLAQLISLSCLAPDIVTAIVEGRQPASLTARSLFACELPVAWSEQRNLLGFS